jgi:AcrR family transcriptional regulator
MAKKFQRARSSEAKHEREADILEAARALATRNGVRQVTLTDIAKAVGLHKSAMLRYFETREQVFLVLTGEGWREWSAAVRKELVRRKGISAKGTAAIFAKTLAARPLFCDLLGQAPMNLERNVSIEAVRAFKTIALREVEEIASELVRLVGLTFQQSINTIVTATSMAGALWQMATAGPAVQALYRSEPQFAHAVVDLEPKLTDILDGLLTGYLVQNSERR